MIPFLAVLVLFLRMSGGEPNPNVIQIKNSNLTAEDMCKDICFAVNKNYAGNDIGYFNGICAPGDCWELCKLTDPACKAWTWNRMSYTCYIKTKVGDYILDDDTTISGVDWCPPLVSNAREPYRRENLCCPRLTNRRTEEHPWDFDLSLLRPKCW
jgi:hypothetical protein